METALTQTDSDNLRRINQLAALTRNEREESKKEVLKIYATAGKITPEAARLALEKLNKEDEERQAKEKSCKITRQEIAERVRDIRRHFEALRERTAGAIFDVAVPGMPRSLDNISDADERELHDMVASLNPEVTQLFDYLSELLEGKAGDKLFDCHYHSIELAFQIGMFAGIIFACDSPAEIDRAEKGLVVASAARQLIVKE
jgi:hypothetical protein